MQRTTLKAAMKVTVLVMLLFSVALGDSYTPEQTALFKGLMKECQEETQAEWELVRKLTNGHITDDVKLKNLLFCFLTKMNLMNENSSVDEEALKKVADGLPPPANKILHKCADERGPTGMETAFLISKCYLEGFPDNTKPRIDI